MGDIFFGGTLDDLLNDQDLLELARLALPSPSPPQPVGTAPTRPSLFEPLALSHQGSRQGPGDPPSLFDDAINGPASAFPSCPFGPDPVPRPTRSGPRNRPTPAASRRPELSRLNASAHAPRILENQTNSPSRHAFPRPAFPAPLDSGSSAFSSSLHFRGVPNSSTSSTPRQRNRREHSPSERGFHSLSSAEVRPRNSHRNSDFAAIDRTEIPPARAPHNYGADDGNPGSPPSVPSPSPAMSTAARHRRPVRPGDLTMPSAPNQAGFRRGSASRTARRSTSQPSQPDPNSSVNKRKREADDDDLFGDDPFGHQVLDLVDQDEVPPEILNKSREKGKNYLKLSTLDCVICMDSATDLTVTHCGHLFCSACLHSALTMDGSRSICPICRQKIEKMPASGKFGQRAKGFYPLELKLMTKKTLERKPGQSSDVTS